VPARISRTAHLKHIPFPFFPGSSAEQAEDAETDPLPNSASLRLSGISQNLSPSFRSWSDRTSSGLAARNGEARRAVGLSVGSEARGAAAQGAAGSPRPRPEPEHAAPAPPPPGKATLNTGAPVPVRLAGGPPAGADPPRLTVAPARQALGPRGRGCRCP